MARRSGCGHMRHGSYVVRRSSGLTAPPAPVVNRSTHIVAMIRHQPDGRSLLPHAQGCDSSLLAGRLINLYRLAGLREHLAKLVLREQLMCLQLLEGAGASDRDAERGGTDSVGDIGY